MVRKKSANAAPASTIEGREQQLTNLAVNLAEQQLRDGTASTSVIVHYLKVASTRNLLEIESARLEQDALRAKIRNLEANTRNEEQLERAIAAFTSYKGTAFDD